MWSSCSQCFIGSSLCSGHIVIMFSVLHRVPVGSLLCHRHVFSALSGVEPELVISSSHPGGLIDLSEARCIIVMPW